MGLIQLFLVSAALAQDAATLSLYNSCLHGTFRNSAYAACGSLQSNRYDPQLTPDQRAAVKQKYEQLRSELFPPNSAQTQTSNEPQRSDQLLLIFITIIGWIAIIGGPIYIFKALRRKSRDEEFAKLPKDGPMRIKIKEEHREAGSFNSKRYPFELHIEVVISQNDWRAIASAGLMDAVLFEYPGFSGNPYDPENLNPFQVKSLRKPAGVFFGNAMQIQEAKEKLIDGLHNLRSHIDAQREGSQTEHIEI
jgi:hypothetical protein